MAVQVAGGLASGDDPPYGPAYTKASSAEAATLKTNVVVTG